MLNEKELIKALKATQGLGVVFDKELIAWAVKNAEAALEPKPAPPGGPGAPGPLGGRILSVPFNSQWEPDAGTYSKDCGGAAVEMVGEYFNPGTDLTTKKIFEAMTGGVNRGTYAWELVKVLTDLYNVKAVEKTKITLAALRYYIDQGKPVIILGQYGRFLMRRDWNYKSGHWFVVVGYDSFEYHGKQTFRYIVHDSDWWDPTEQGAFLPVVEKHFVSLWGAYNNLGIVCG